LLLLPTTGCVPVGAVVNKFVGEPPVPPRYVPDKTKPMLVLVENFRNPDAGRMDAQRVTIHVAEELKRFHIAPVVTPEDAESLRGRADYHDMKVEEVGRAAGARQVLYVNLQPVKVDNTVAGEMLKARTELRVRVVDVESGQTLWPQDTPQGQTLVAESPWVRSPTGDREGLPEPELRDQVARSAAHQIVKLFRTWRPDDEEQDLEETVR
jgi:TolB-like protein